jgi:hypothetical protein
MQAQRLQKDQSDLDRASTARASVQSTSSARTQRHNRLDIQVNLHVHDTYLTDTTPRHKLLTRDNVVWRTSTPATVSQTSPFLLLPRTLQRQDSHQHGAAHHDRPGASSAESLFQLFANAGITCPFVHVTRNSLDVSTSMTRCCAVMVHEYLSWACECFE